MGGAGGRDLLAALAVKALAALAVKALAALAINALSPLRSIRMLECEYRC